MTPKVFVCLLSILLLVSPSRAQDRAPHGLAYENPVAFSPAAVDFFHPKTQPDKNSPCTESSSACSPLPLAAQVEASDISTTTSTTKSGKSSRLGGGGIAGIVVGLAFAVLLAMGGFYVFITRRRNMKNRDNCVIPDA